MGVYKALATFYQLTQDAAVEIEYLNNLPQGIDDFVVNRCRTDA